MDDIDDSEENSPYMEDYNLDYDEDYEYGPDDNLDMYD